jgi:glutamine synthetase
MGFYSKKDMSREEVRKGLEKAQVKFLWAQFVDIHGSPKVKQVPIGAFDDIVDAGAGFAGGAVWGVNQGPHSHDLMARADIHTFRQLPWQPNTAVAQCNLYVDEEPWQACSRVNLLRMVEAFRKEGYVMNGGWEPEHFLVVRNADGTISGWDRYAGQALLRRQGDLTGCELPAGSPGSVR